MIYRHDPWPLPRREAGRHLCTMEGHDQPATMIHRYGSVGAIDGIGGVFADVWVCPMHDGEAFDSGKINPSFGHKRCPNRECLRRWEHTGDCP